jgi:serine/threonine protein phosphatase PrpC
MQDLPGRLVIGTAGHAFEARPVHGPGVPGADTECDGWSTDAFTVRWAAVRGDWHRYYHQPRQDQARTAVHQASGAVVFAVADGVSSAETADVGALEACSAAVREILDQMDRGAWPIDLRQVATAAADALRWRAAHWLRTASPPDEAVENLYATTLVAGVILPGRPGLSGATTASGGAGSAGPSRPRHPGKPDRPSQPGESSLPAGPTAALVRIGDSCAWVLDRETGQYRALFQPKSDHAVISNAVSALPRVPTEPETALLALDPRLILLVGTDGIGDPLGDGTGEVGTRVAEQLLPAPPRPLAFVHLLDFSRETYDDDRALLAVWTHEGPT